MRPSVYLCLFVIGKVLSEGTESRLVQIAQGPVRGYKYPQDDIFIFYGIPYAKAPTGSDKFKAPLPGPTWSEPLDAVDNGVVCPQLDVYGFLSDNQTMTEDCLIANVYTPNTNETNLPVAVYVHGGGFISGFGTMSEPKGLVSLERVVAVTFNYRLAAHGFLCLGTEDIPGNVGLKDQVALLRWVQTNIKHFGGDPNNVTIAGYSAGASSVLMLMISKMAKGLFNKVIPENGDITSAFSVQVNPTNNIKEYAKLLGLDEVENVDNLESFFKNASYEVLNSADIGFEYNTVLLVTPCVEKDVGQEMFLADSPLNIIKNGDFDMLPMLFGFTNMEGLLRIDYFDQWKEIMNTNFEYFLPPDLQFRNEEDRDNIIKNIKKFYFNDEPVDYSNVLGYVYYLTDVLFSCPSLRTAKLLLEVGHDNIYLYQYSYVDDDTPVVPHTNVKGANHAADACAVLDGINITIPNDDSNISNEFKTWKQFMRDIWLHFIENGKPESSQIPEWEPVKVNATHYMALKERPEVGEFLLNDRCGFWQQIYDQHYLNPVPPSWP